ncbi:unnamed protein product [Brassicogethes aeneus]|uniref:Uncharacterized protein n=1 Tax=Brassicogethes aeneus TaxID=1431903 RepID=A0A9P0BG74_BRAAE|nr:unnamed protein product [Brassicogethes aeneus]
MEVRDRSEDELEPTLQVGSDRPESKVSTQMRLKLPSVALACDGTGVSDRAAAIIANAVLEDIGLKAILYSNQNQPILANLTNVGEAANDLPWPEEDPYASDHDSNDPDDGIDEKNLVNDELDDMVEINEDSIEKKQ